MSNIRITTNVKVPEFPIYNVPFFITTSTYKQRFPYLLKKNQWMLTMKRDHHHLIPLPTPLGQRPGAIVYSLSE